MKIQQISASDTLTQQVVSAMVSRSTVLEFAEFYSITGNAEYRRKAATASGGKFRALNEDYPTNQVTPQYAQPALKILGDKVEVDRAYERRALDIASERGRQLMNFARDLGKQFQYYFFQGDTSQDSIAFDGLAKLMPATQKIVAAENGLTVTLGNDSASKTTQQKFLELLNKLIQKVDGGAQVLYMNGDVLSRLTTIARDSIQFQPDTFGKIIPYYNGIPLRDAGYDAEGNYVLPFNETCGESTTCTSIYAVRFGEAADVSIATNIGVEVKDLGLVGVHYTHSVEFDVAPVILNDKACAQLAGIKL